MLNNDRFIFKKLLKTNRFLLKKEIKLGA